MSTCSIFRIPSELLIDIFLLCFPSISRDYLQDLENERIEPDYPHVALQLSHVCGHWRTLALSTSRLWSQLIILVSGSEGLETPLSTSTLLEWTRHYLKYSRDQPLEIVLRTPNYSQKQREFFQPLIDLLLQESRRWKRVHLSLLGSQIESLLLPESMPVLEFFHLHAADTSPAMNKFPPLFAPRLQELAITDVPFPHSSRIAMFETSPNLVRLYLSHISVYSTLQCLVRAPPTVSVDVHIAFDYHGPLISTPIVSYIPTLVTQSSNDLSVANPALNDPLYDLFNNIASLPNVHLFDFTGDSCQGGPFPHLPFIFFLSRRRSNETPITKLSFKWWILEDKFLIQILDLLPTLEHLAIDENFPAASINQRLFTRRRDRTLSSLFFRALRIPKSGSSSNCLLPRLTHLTLVFERTPDCIAMEDMIQSRRRDLQCTGPHSVPFSRLGYISISMPREVVAVEDVESLQMMDGVVVELS
ncbi:hypothetical protein VKT23_018297 [Stygiomarasmius scandens]|uniref:F-box domain-containing protein n=1 Tax=Marasmiellus scandens TaxID=2682957 RepID=A0ABR1IP96_9AGAR